jgi:hypothetical protein
MIRKLTLLIAILLGSVAIGQEMAGPLEVMPSPGKSTAVVRATTAGRWFVLSTDLKPVQNKAYKLTPEAGGGSLIIWEGDPGSKYTVLFVPDSVTESLSATTVTLSGTTTVPPPVDNPTDPIKPPLTRKVTAVTYVYEKDQNPVPPQVVKALADINKEGLAVATYFDDDNTSGKDTVPEQYKVALSAAKQEGLPCLVVVYSSGPPKVVKDPKTTQEVMEALK